MNDGDWKSRYEAVKEELERLTKELDREKKKNEILHRQNLELMQEMESIRDDFGDQR